MCFIKTLFATTLCLALLFGSGSGCRETMPNGGGDPEDGAHTSGESVDTRPSSPAGGEDSAEDGDPQDEVPPQVISTVPIPLIDLGKGNYHGFTGGLYPQGSNEMPPDHASMGFSQALKIKPLDKYGIEDAINGKYVLLSIGPSNAGQEYCLGDGKASTSPSSSHFQPTFSCPASCGTSCASLCDDWTFVGQAALDSTVNKNQLVIVNGAIAGQGADTWDAATDPNYDTVANCRLAAYGVTKDQVQIVWVKTFNGSPTVSLPDSHADAYALVASYGNIVRALKARYPNIKQVFFSSRTYGGYNLQGINPEPYAYEAGFAIKWVVQAQVDQMANGGKVVDTRAGDLNYTIAPWLAWGPYLWADGMKPRSDGLTWDQNDFDVDGSHPSTSGEQKVGARLLEFFKTSPQTQCWFLASGTCS